MMLEWSDNGKRTRISVKTRSWSEAEQRARAMMQDAHARTIGEPPKAGEPVSLDLAIEMFTAKKSGKHKETRRTYQYTLNNLKAWASKNGRLYLSDITESALEKYQATWTLQSNYAKRNEQERLRSFFRYCCASAEVKLAFNPTSQLEHFNVTSDEPEDPYTDKEYAAIVAAVDKCKFELEIADRIRALIAVMRYAGLAIQDAAILKRDAVTPAQVGGTACYRVMIRRSKTPTGVDNVIPKAVGEALLKVANGNPHYIFWSGNGEPVSTVKHWHARLKKVFDASGVTNAHSHRFRKTFGVELQERVRQRIQRLMLAAPRADPIREAEKVFLVNLMEDGDHGLLDNFVL